MPNILRHRAQVHNSIQAEPPPLRIVVVYDGFTDLIRIVDIWSDLISCFGDEIQIASCAWNFTSLRDLQLRERAARHAAEADLIVLSASGRHEPPDHIRLWINAWLPDKRGRCDALVAALDHQSPRPAELPLRNYLRHAARRCGMDFFCNAGL